MRFPDSEGWTCQSCGADNFVPAGWVRPRWRGLPYRWWRSHRLWNGIVAMLVAALMLAMLTLVVLAWWSLLP